MLFGKKGQSTAEYAIVLGLVAAVAAGFLSVALKGAIRTKAQQATGLLVNADDSGTLAQYSGTDTPIYSQEVSQTKVLSGDNNFKNVTVMEKGGKELRHQLQTTESASVSLETLDATQQ